MNMGAVPLYPVTALETTAQAIKAKTDNLPVDPAGVSDLPTVPSATDNAAAILADPANLLLTDASGRVEVSGTVNDFDTLIGADSDTLKTLSDQLDSVASAAAGAGSETVTIECLDASSLPLEGVAVWVTSDSAGADIKAGTLYSNTLGRVTVYLDPGAYYVWRQGEANWFNPQSITVTDL